jgi:hypothetical protein
MPAPLKTWHATATRASTTSWNPSATVSFVAGAVKPSTPEKYLLRVPCGSTHPKAAHEQCEFRSAIPRRGAAHLMLQSTTTKSRIFLRQVHFCLCGITWYTLYHEKVSTVVFVAVKEALLSDAWQFHRVRVARMDVSVGSRRMTSTDIRAAIGQMDIYRQKTEIRPDKPRNRDHAGTGRFRAFRCQAPGLPIKPLGRAVGKPTRRGNDVGTTSTRGANLDRALLPPPNNRTAISHNWLVVRSHRLVPRRRVNRPTQSTASR